MPLVPTNLFPTFYDAIQEAASEAMILYNRALDPNDNVTVQVETGFGPKIPISLNTSKGIRSVDADKAADVFGKALAAKLTPVLVVNIDAYIRTGTVTVATPTGPGTGTIL
jgi:hypothetical protein